MSQLDWPSPASGAFGRGQVWHRREGPRAHAFRYRLYYSLLDVDGLESIFARSRLWSIERFNLVSFRRSDYLAPGDMPVAEAVRARVAAETGHRPGGRVLVLSHLRQWGLCFNPVTFYFCLADGGAGEQLAFIVAEVHNTPWGERHAYVLDCREMSGPDYRFRFPKAFHVSPFLPMGMAYDWRFTFASDTVSVHMLVTADDTQSFSAGMKLAMVPMTRTGMRRMPLVFPFMTLRVLVGIYWQALRLWIKRTPFHDHPDKEHKRA